MNQLLLGLLVLTVVFLPVWFKILSWWYQIVIDSMDWCLSFVRKEELSVDKAMHSRGERARTKLANAVHDLREEAVRLKSSEEFLKEKLEQSESGWPAMLSKHKELQEKFDALNEELNSLREAREKAENELADTVAKAATDKEQLVDRAEDAENELDISRARLAITTKERDELAESVEGIFNPSVTAEERMQAMDKLRRHPAIKRLLEV